MDRFAFDDDYVRRLREHDARTEQHFVDFFQPRLFNHLRKRIGSLSDVNDLRQDTLTRVLQKIYDGKVRQGGALFGFVFRVCDIRVLEHYRDKKLEALEDHAEPMYDDDPIDDLITRETQQQVQQVLDELEPRDAKLLRAFFILGVSRDEYCREHRITKDYFRVLLHRALKRFAEKFPPDDETNSH
ncbi:MAG TPA: sigma-70 family RNA polymerase sigma factor [Vicinamibacterales bacterium]|nr:sigma-70 family RNA polymerase sigma factor [Vicinamibacterales bacterium]